jgi:hypothetical protein
MEEIEKSHWEAWIRNHTPNASNTPYDKIAEMAVYSYGLSERSRKEHLVDQKHYFIIWWGLNRGKFQNYNSLEKIGKLLNINHTSVIHHLYSRKKSPRFKENVSCLLDFLTS